MLMDSPLPCGAYVRIGSIAIRVDSYVRSDPRFAHVTILATGSQIVIDMSVMQPVADILSPLEVLAYQAEKQTNSDG